MKKNEMIKLTKNYILSAAIALSSVAMLTGCGKQEEAVVQPQVETSEEATEADTEVPESDVDYPTNEMEERAGKTSFESYDEIIGLLKPEEAYALVNIKGYDGQVLLITNFTYDNLDGNMAAVEATPYTVKSNGKVSADSMFVAGGTANPIAIDSEGVVYLGTHTTMDRQCYGTNGTDDVGVMLLSTVYIDEFDEEGKPAKVGGFIRTKNTVIDDDSEDIESDNVAIFDEMFEEYSKAKVVNFTVVK